MFADFRNGLAAHARGIRFAVARKDYLGLAAIPFVLTCLIFFGGFWLFAANSDRMLAFFWSPQQVQATGVLVASLYWLYIHLAKYLLYLLVVVLLYFLFMVTANILAAPLYDRIAGRLRREALGESGHDEAPGLSLGRTMIEECKKAVFVVAVPLAVVCIPVLGQVLAPLVAAWLLAYDFVDFSLCLDTPRFADRLRFARSRPLLLLGFGLPLLIPVLNIVLYPFAILGACLLYQRDRGHDLSALPRK